MYDKYDFICNRCKLETHVLFSPLEKFDYIIYSILSIHKHFNPNCDANTVMINEINGKLDIKIIKEIKGGG